MSATQPALEERRALDALRDSESRFRILAECAPVVVWMTDETNSCTYISRYWREYTGRDPQQDIGHTWIQAVLPEDRERVVRDLVIASQSGRSYQGEYRFKRGDGQYGWTAVHAAPYYYADGSFAGYIGTCSDITEHKTAERNGYRIQDNLVLGQEAERRRVARELHDGIGQRIALLIMSLAEIEPLVPASASALNEKLKGVATEVGKVATDLHRLSLELHPSSISHLGLIPALRQLCSEFSKVRNLAVDFVASADCAGMSEEMTLALYRIGQECLANVAKHSKGREAKVLLIQSSTEIRLTIIDNGVGFDVSQVQLNPGLGLISMYERARMLGAELEIRSSPSHGTQIELRMPWSLKKSG